MDDEHRSKVMKFVYGTIRTTNQQSEGGGRRGQGRAEERDPESGSGTKSIRFDQLLQNTRNKKNLKQTTDIDWEKLCEELCASGDGGDLCNCEIHPFKHKALEFARKPKASEDTDIDWDQVCKELCASGDGGDLCNCEIHLKALDFARKPKASEDTDIDWDQVCKELCASGDGGDLCNFDCGRQSLRSLRQPKIIGGFRGGEFENIWHLSIHGHDPQTNESFESSCGAVLLNRRWALTAAHCVHDSVFNTVLPPQFWRVSFSSTSNTSSLSYPQLDHREGPPSRPQRYELSDIVIHEKFNQSTWRNDLALLRLAQPINFSSKREGISPVCLPKTPFKFHSEILHFDSCTVSGHGRTEVSLHSETLLTASMHILPMLLCKKYYQSRAVITEDMLCARGDIAQVPLVAPGGSIDRRQAVVASGPCVGDSGGPLVCRGRRDRVPYLVGITSWGAGCGDAKYPGVFVRVSSYLDWIQETLRPGHLIKTLWRASSKSHRQFCSFHPHVSSVYDTERPLAASTGSLREIMTAMTPGSSVCFLQVLLVVCLFYFLALGSSSAVEALEVAGDAGKPLEDDGDSYMAKRQHYRMIRDIAEDPSALRSLIRDLLNEAASKQKPRFGKRGAALPALFGTSYPSYGVVNNPKNPYSRYASVEAYD
ncbi:unnamed protein product [Cyprideis torosa]|uniref:Acrosin n=1 Tax=Cyprideis torosa TaxID=163714 RepID=A0A7R8W4X1_9CRUS|nr:unnamed protein product [Cyprideis torosa]CAG0884557.1 unnamed protein product [Cyprideis torosa]